MYVDVHDSCRVMAGKDGEQMDDAWNLEIAASELTYALIRRVEWVSFAAGEPSLLHSQLRNTALSSTRCLVATAVPLSSFPMVRCLCSLSYQQPALIDLHTA
jgi:hypothetical protein